MLTGGGIGTAVLSELAAAPARDAVDWRQLEVWWGDERFVPSGDKDRNETGARAALLDHVDVDPARVYPMPPSDGPDGADPDAAAARYATWLKQAAAAEDHGAVPSVPEDHGLVPSFDVLLLGIGPEGHIASLFPGMPALYDERSVVAVRNSPKPPPDAAVADAGIDQRGQGGMDPGLGEGKAARSRWPCPAPARCRYPRQARTGGSAPCFSWTPTQPSSCRQRSGRRLTEPSALSLHCEPARACLH